MRTIVVTGTYSSANKGDAAMQWTMASLAGEHMPGVEPVIGCPFPERDRAYYAPHRVVRSTRRWLPLAMAHVVMLWLARTVGLRLRRYPFDAEIDAMARADAVVDLSGDMLTEDYGLLVAVSHLMPLLQAVALRRPLVVCAQSIGPYRRLAPVVRFLFRRAAAVTAREQVTYEWLSRIGGVPAHLTADLAFALPPAAPERVAAVAADEGVDRIGRPLLGVSVSALLGNRRNRHLPAASGDLLDAFAAALDAVASRHGLHLLLVSHVVGPGAASDDRDVSRRLAARLAAPCTVLQGELRPEEIKGLIARCTAFVGCRMHANIAALDSGVPTLAVGYSHKTAGIMASLGMEDWVLAIDQLDTQGLEAALERLLSDRDACRAKLESRLPEIRALAATNMEFVRRAAAGVADV